MSLRVPSFLSRVLLDFLMLCRRLVEPQCVPDRLAQWMESLGRGVNVQGYRKHHTPHLSESNLRMFPILL